MRSAADVQMGVRYTYVMRFRRYDVEDGGGVQIELQVRSRRRQELKKRVVDESTEKKEMECVAQTLRRQIGRAHV